MADASRDPTPSGWGDAFAALPLESPPASRWPQIAARLDAPARPARKPRHWLALAAGLCALAALPLAWTLRDAGDDGDARDEAATAAIVAAPRIDPPTATRVDPAAETAVDMSAASPTVAVAPTPSATDTARATQRSQRRGRRLAATEAATATPHPESAAVAADDAPERTLESLYAASTQLETLLALARDTRVESGPAAALAGALDADLATIDAQLAQPNLPSAERLSLWQARVETLQASAGFESQLRLIAAHGGQLDGALVSID